MRTILYTLLLFLSGGYASAQCNAVITPSGPTTFCDGDDVILVGSVSNTYQWYLNGNSIGGAINSTYTASVAGSYTLETDSVGCVSMSAPVVVTVNTVPAQPGSITGSGIVCDGTTYTYSVDPVPGATSYFWGGGINWQSFYGSTPGPTHTAVAGGSDNSSSPVTTIGVTAENSCGSSTPSTLSVMSYSPVDLGGMNPFPDVSNMSGIVCVGATADLYANWHPHYPGYSVVTSYEWYRDGIAIPGANGQWLTIDEGGDYSVLIYNNTCPANLVKNHISQKIPTPHVYPEWDVTFCAGSNMALNVLMDYTHYNHEAYEFVWQLDGVDIPGTINAYSCIPQVAGHYAVRVRNIGPFGCDDTSHSVNVTFSNFTAPIVTINQNGNILTATSGFTSYQWYRNGTPITGATGESYTIVSAGMHTVVVNDANMCTASASIGLDVQKISEADFELKIFPNPNSGLFNISADIPRESRFASLIITDITGKQVMIKTISVVKGTIEGQIRLDNSITPGMYFLKLSSPGFNKVVSFVKQ